MLRLFGLSNSKPPPGTTKDVGSSRTTSDASDASPIVTMMTPEAKASEAMVVTNEVADDVATEGGAPVSRAEADLALPDCANRITPGQARTNKDAKAPTNNSVMISSPEEIEAEMQTGPEESLQVQFSRQLLASLTQEDLVVDRADSTPTPSVNGDKTIAAATSQRPKKKKRIRAIKSTLKRPPKARARQTKPTTKNASGPANDSVPISSTEEIEAEPRTSQGLSTTPPTSDTGGDEPGQVQFARRLLDSITQDDLEMLHDSTHDSTPTPSVGDNETEPTDDTGEAPKKKARGRTVKSSSQNNKKVRARQIKPGCRVSTQRKRLIYWCTTDSQRDCLSIELADTSFFYGTVTGGTAQGGYTIKFDIFPEKDSIIKKVKRKFLTVLGPGDDEPMLDPKLAAAMKEEENALFEKRKSCENQSEDTFSGMGKEMLKEVGVYNLQYDRNKESVKWKILADGEHIRNCPKYKKIKEKSYPNVDNVDFTKTLSENFFSHVWPDMTGSGKIMDEYLADPRAAYHITASERKIKFHDPNAIDHDWKVKQCILGIVAAASEIENGFCCWKAGPGPGRKAYPDFGQWIPLHEMKCFVSTVSFIWARKRWWYVDRRDLDWDMFMPFVEKWNQTRVKLLVAFLLILDESMSGWRPKTSKRGHLPHITFEPRKPVNLGTMLRDACECVTGIIMYVDPVMCPEQQNIKAFSDLENPVPCGKRQEESNVSGIRYITKNRNVQVLRRICLNPKQSSGFDRSSLLDLSETSWSWTFLFNRNV
jgi:hypothetical protein